MARDRQRHNLKFSPKDSENRETISFARFGIDLSTTRYYKFATRWHGTLAFHVQALNTTYCDLAADWINNTGGGYCGGTLSGIIDRLDYIEVWGDFGFFLLFVAAPGEVGPKLTCDL